MSTSIPPSGPLTDAVATIANDAQQTLDPIDVSDPTADASEVEYPAGFKFMSLWLVVSLCLLLIGLDNSILSVAVPAITDEFKTITDIGWYLASARLTLCAFQFMFGKMYAVFSVKRMYLISLFILGLGSTVSASAPKSHILILGRAISGIGAAGLIAGTFVLITYTVPLHKRAMYGAILGATESGAATAGPVLGGVVTQKISWRWCFYINLPVVALTFIGIVFVFQEPLGRQDATLLLKQKIAKLDLLGTAVFVPAITAVMIALQWGGTTYGWGDARIIALFVTFGVLIVLFTYLQWRAKDDATLPGRIIGNRSILAGMWFVACVNASMAVVYYYMPIYLQTAKQFSPAKTGLLVLPSTAGLIVGSVISGPGITKVGYYVPFMIGGGCLLPIAVGLLSTLKVDADIAQLIGYQFLLGLFTGFGIQGPQVAAQTVLKTPDVSMGIAAIIFAQNFGPTIFTAVAQTIFTNRLTNDFSTYAPNLNATVLSSVGLTELKEYVGPKYLPEVELSYDKAVTQIFYLGVALACLSIFGAVSTEWRSVKKKNN